MFFYYKYHIFFYYLILFFCNICQTIENIDVLLVFYGPQIRQLEIYFYSILYYSSTIGYKFIDKLFIHCDSSEFIICRVVIWKYLFANKRALSAFLPFLPTISPFFESSTETIAVFRPSVFSINFINFSRFDVN